MIKKWIRIEIIFMLIFILPVFKYSNGCNFPVSWDGNWHDSTERTLIFSRSSLKVTSGWEVTLGGSSVTSWTCVAEDTSNKYFVFRGDTSLQYFSSNIIPYLCIQWTEVTTSSFYYYFQADFQSNVNERVYLEMYNPGITSWTATTYCSPSNPPGAEEFRVAVKEGQENSAFQDFSALLQGYFTYTYTSGGTQFCSSGSTLDICSDTMTATFDYSQCSKEMLFSSEGVLKCVAKISHGSITYFSIYNPGTVDYINYFKFSCLAVSSTSGTISMSVSSGSCQQSQTPTSATSTGGVLSLSITGNCSSDLTTADDSTTALTTDEPLTTEALTTTASYATQSNTNANKTDVSVQKKNWFCKDIDVTICYSVLIAVCFAGTLVFSGLFIIFCAQKTKQKQNSKAESLPIQLLVQEMKEPKASPPATTRI